MIRYNNLKIFINAGEAKPGGLIGAMLSPYLFSTNMTDFCKKFNELSLDFVNGLPLNVKIFSDIQEKSYTFFIKIPSITLIYYGFLKNNLGKKKLSILYIFDLIKFFSFHYNVSLYKSTLIIFGIMRSFKKKKIFLDFSNIFKSLLNKQYGSIKK